MIHSRLLYIDVYQHLAKWKLNHDRVINIQDSVVACLPFFFSIRFYYTFYVQVLPVNKMTIQYSDADQTSRHDIYRAPSDRSNDQIYLVCNLNCELFKKYREFIPI